MAKTIAMQRGTATINTTTPITLFTQSGGYATKVMCNQLVFYATSGSLYYPRCELALYTSSGANTTLGLMYYSSGMGAMQFLPHSGQFAQMLIANTNASGTIACSSGGATTATGTSSLTYPANDYYRSDNFQQMLHPPQEFYIGPGDSLVAKYAADYNNTVKVGWSFTTITES